jgi:ATP-dependent RNA helicase DHX57
MLRARQQLPAWAFRERVVDLIRENQVVLVCGHTGCGKSTQIPQFVLDDLIARGQAGGVRMICTQPRRISAIGLAERVSSERAMRVGGQVGYRIRLENKTSRDTRLEFVTVGILLRQLTTAASDASMLGNISHIFIDEVHERSVDIDFLLMILKQVRKANPRLRIVLMSATVDAQLFQSYFDGCPAISIPGKTFPVEDYYLSDLYSVLDYRPRGKFSNRGLDGDALEEAVALEQALDKRDRRTQEAKTADFGLETETEAFEAAVKTATSQIDYDLLEHTVSVSV